MARLSDSEYLELVHQLLDDPRTIMWSDEEFPDEVILRTGTFLDGDNALQLQEGATGF